ncbi:MAG: hypothetical protein ACI89X_000165 [Planctomycetota bacterium]|jgi:hypothetical protein
MSKLAKNLNLIVVALTAMACATPIELPNAFVELQDSGVGYRAVTSDDARVWVRTLYDATPGNVGFWADSLERDFVLERGYELLEKGAVRNFANRDGRWMEFSTNVRGKRVDYLVAVWSDRRWPAWLAKGDWIQVVEFAASHDVYVERVEAMRAALSTVR